MAMLMTYRLITELSMFIQRLSERTQRHSIPLGILHTLSGFWGERSTTTEGIRVQTAGEEEKKATSYCHFTTTMVAATMKAESQPEGTPCGRIDDTNSRPVTAVLRDFAIKGERKLKGRSSGDSNYSLKTYSYYATSDV